MTMLDGQPFLLVVGASDTGRAPLLAALVAHQLPGVTVRSAGVTAHEGEPADAPVALALQQLGLQAGEHRARSVQPDEVAAADLLLAVDEGIARVIEARHSAARQTVVLSKLIDGATIADLHRMPLGVWVAAARSWDEQVRAALPQLRSALGLQSTGPPSRQRPMPVLPTPPKSGSSAADERQQAVDQLVRLIDTAILLPSIVDWERLRFEARATLGRLATQAEGPQDLTPAATLMIQGLLGQTTTMPTMDRLQTLHGAVQRLAAPLDAAGLAALGGTLSTWNLTD